MPATKWDIGVSALASLATGVEEKACAAMYPAAAAFEEGSCS